MTALFYKLFCYQGRLPPGDPEVRTPSIQQKDPWDSRKSELFGWMKGVGGSGGKSTTTRHGPPSSENMAPTLFVITKRSESSQ